MINIKKFSASWCAPCKKYDPIIQKVVDERDDVTLTRIDVDEDKDTAERYRVLSVPFTVLEDDSGNLLGGFSGAVTAPQLHKIIDAYRVR